MRIKQHLLSGDGIDFSESPNQGGVFEAGHPDTIVIHYTAGGSVESAVRTLSDPARKASAHVVVGRDGSITQLVPFQRIAWHAGRSSFRGRSGLNRYAVGIEIDNAGRLQQTGPRFTAWFGRDYPLDDVIEAVHRNESVLAPWHRYTEAQIGQVEALCETLIAHYPITSIVGHEEISPGRKSDPGPAFPLDKLRQRLLAEERAEDGAMEEPKAERVLPRGLVAVSELNIRSRPTRAAVTIAPPLSRGTLVNILDERDGWYQVDIAIRGWVNKDFIQA